MKCERDWCGSPPWGHFKSQHTVSIFLPLPNQSPALPVRDHAEDPLGVTVTELLADWLWTGSSRRNRSLWVWRYFWGICYCSRSRTILTKTDNPCTGILHPWLLLFLLFPGESQHRHQSQQNHTSNMGLPPSRQGTVLPYESAQAWVGRLGTVSVALVV